MLNVLLLINDLPAALNIKSFIDSMEGFCCYMAPCAESMQIARKRAAKIIIIDKDIEDNVDCITKIKAIQNIHNSQVVLLTSHDKNDMKIRTSSATISGYISKPIKEAELLSSLLLCAMTASTPPPMAARVRLWLHF